MAPEPDLTRRLFEPAPEPSPASVTQPVNGLRTDDLKVTLNSKMSDANASNVSIATLDSPFGDEEPFSRIVSATRLHLPADATGIPEGTEQHLRNYFAMAQNLGVEVAIAVNSHMEAVRGVAEEVAPSLQVNVLHVPCWGAFVPALNALLNFAQRAGMKYILYQSLETKVTGEVLHRLLDHHTKDTLVVGPVFDGHNFIPGEQALNGRTTPWNTLALWSVRKLALTGFLCIADGLPETRSINKNPGGRAAQLDIMGSDDWWSAGDSRHLARQVSEAGTAERQSVPAGVEEVTAIALLQHLHGTERARAILLELPPQLESQLSWTASWGKDERRKAWHKYKMASKVSRPAAQLEQLFQFQKGAPGPVRALGTFVGLRRRSSSASDLPAQENAQAGDTAARTDAREDADQDGGDAIHAGTVMHFGESIVPPLRVKGICLAAYNLFSANSTSVLAFAFRQLNEPGAATASSMSSLISVCFLIGGVYLPMPLSLWLTRAVTRRADHIAGLILFAVIMLIGQLVMVVASFIGANIWVLVGARLLQGLGSGVLFQVRFILASMTTSDRMQELQSLSFLVSDLGLGMGALLPAATSLLIGSMSSDLGPAMVVLALVSSAYLIVVLLVFPRRPHFLPDRVRFNQEPKTRQTNSPSSAPKKPIDRFRVVVWISGTTRVFVQSAILPVVALSMRDAHWTGNFRQTIAVGAICLLPMPVEALASRVCCSCSQRADSDHRRSYVALSKMAAGTIGVVSLVIASAKPRDLKGEDGEIITLLTRLCELAILMIALAIAAPFNASRLNQLKDAERSMVLLEWMKAYAGRMGGPLFAVLVYRWAGYGPVLSVLVIATAIVTLTA